MTKALATVAILLWVVTALAAGFFFVKGRAISSPDGRTAVLLSRTERDFVLAEMRMMLASVQEITQALSQADYARAAQAARSASRHDAARIPIGLMAKMPLEFRSAGRSMHEGFDDMANAMEQRGALPDLYGKLADQLGACVGCHASYKIELEQ